MTATATQAFDQTSFDAFIGSRQEPEWLLAARREAWRLFQDLPLPSRANEEWMRTDIRLLRLDRFAPARKPDSATPQPSALLSQGVELSGGITTIDGHIHECGYDSSPAKKGVLFGCLESIATEHPELVQRHFGHVVASSADKFSALQGAWFTGGTLLYVPKGVVIEQPFHSLSALTNQGVDLGRTLVVLEDGAEATLLAETTSLEDGASGLHCGAIELIVGRGARLRYVNLQNWGSGVWHFAHQKAMVREHGRLQWTIAALGSRLAKVNQHVALVEPNAHAQVNGVIFSEGKQHLAYHTLQHHEAPQCQSDLLYKGALQDAARIVWRGMIKVDPGAQKTDGYQRNDNLMLSDHARSDSIPGLEIEADDVRCTHGSTTGRVDEEQVFYAQTRGFTRKEAIRAIVAGFFQQVFDRITIESVREALGSAIGRRIREYE